MAVNLISFPFRLRQNGLLATVEQDSEAHHSEELAIIVLSRPGERDLVPDFGVNDPAYEDLHESEVAAQVELFEVPVTISSVDTEYLDDSTQEVILNFE